MRVRNHAKMVDCYLTTFKNNKGFLGDKKKVAQDIIGKYVRCLSWQDSYLGLIV